MCTYLLPELRKELSAAKRSLGYLRTYVRTCIFNHYNTFLHTYILVLCRVATGCSRKQIRTLDFEVTKRMRMHGS